jgi:hypothetical protein
MNKINGSAKMNISAEKPATAHTLDRSTLFDKDIRWCVKKQA